MSDSSSWYEFGLTVRSNRDETQKTDVTVAHSPGVDMEKNTDRPVRHGQDMVYFFATTKSI